jgi:hypothetical protein
MTGANVLTRIAILGYLTTNSRRRGTLRLGFWSDGPFKLAFGLSGKIVKLSGMTALTAFGLCAVTAMVVCYALESRSRWFVLAFAASCVLGSIYGFLQGAWPFGLVEAVWSVIAVHRWWKVRSNAQPYPRN